MAAEKHSNLAAQFHASCGGVSVEEGSHDEHAKWLLRFPAAVDSQVRLFCLPPAGGGVTKFGGWRQELDRRIELVLVQLPGREARLDEPPIRDRSILLERLARLLLPELSRPFALFGHSFGALLAFDLVRLFRRRGWGKPEHVFFSASRAPHVRIGPTLAHLPDTRLIEAVGRRFGGIPAEIARQPEWVRLILPAMRADIAIDESYEYREEPPLECGVSVFGGTSDATLPRRELEAWRKHAAALFYIREFPGDHFFIQSAESRCELVRAIAEELIVRPGRS